MTKEELAKKMAQTGFRPDTYPDNWKCGICETKEPHVHEVYNRERKMWFYEDHGYDSRDEETQP